MAPIDAPPTAETAPLDLRSLPAPEPMTRTLEAADALVEGMTLAVLTPQMPYPLLQLLEARGFAVAADRRADGSALVQVYRPAARHR